MPISRNDGDRWSPSLLPSAFRISLSGIRSGAQCIIAGVRNRALRFPNAFSVLQRRLESFFVQCSVLVGHRCPHATRARVVDIGKGKSDVLLINDQQFSVFC